MTNLQNLFFGPLNKNACFYFYFLSAFFFFLLVITLVADLLFLVRRSKELNIRVFTSGLLLTFNVFVAYFVNRLLYSMCSKTLV